MSAEEIFAAGQRVRVVVPAGADALPELVAVVARCAQTGPVRVVCANAVSADALRVALGSSAQVVTAQELALTVMQDERVQQVCKRGPRVLDANEEDVLVEDLKVCGMKAGRMREMLKFFRKSLADGTAAQDGWLVAHDEAVLFAILEENLEARRALLSCEVAFRALSGLAEASDALPTMTTVIEDYGALSRTQQQLALAGAAERVVVFGNDTPCTPADEAYPAPQGFAELTDAGFVDAIVAWNVPAPVREDVVQPTPVDEFSQVVQWVRSKVDEGAAPKDVLVAAPNATWARQVAGALCAAGVPVTVDAGQAKVKGDPRDPQGCDALRAAALGKLQVNPGDVVALRSWLGLGDWLLKSDAVLEVLAYARENDMSFADALCALRQPGAAEGLTLFGKLASALDDLDEALTQGAENTASPEEATAAPAQPAAEDAVVVTLHTRAHARHAKHVVVCGVVGGFLPRLDALDDAHTIDHKKRALARDEALFADVCACAQESLLITGFEHDALDNAGVLPMQVQRIYTHRGRRYARIAPSCFIAH